MAEGGAHQRGKRLADLPIDDGNPQAGDPANFQVALHLSETGSQTGGRVRGKHAG